MNKIVYNIVFNRKNRLNKEGKALVQVCAYLKGKRKYFSTHIYLYPHQWNATRRRVCRHPHASELNRMLHQTVTDLEAAELKLWRQGRNFTLSELKEAYVMRTNSPGFLNFCYHEAESEVLKESTKANIRRTLALLQAFHRDVTFAEIDFAFITAFEEYLLHLGYHANTVAKHLKHLKRYVNAAVHKGYVLPEPYPFSHFRIRTIPYKHTHLTPAELESMEALCPDRNNPQLCRVLDAFLFCCYTGLRYSDFVRLRPVNFIEMQQDTWLVYKSQKTGTEVRLPLNLLFEGKALALLDKYSPTPAELFKIPDNSNTNKLLSRLAAMAGLTKTISFHTARHTNATLLLYRGVSITTVQKILGHKNVKTTQVYADIMDMTMVRELKEAWK